MKPSLARMLPLVLGAGLLVGACGQGPAAQSRTPVVGIVQLAPIPAMDEARAGLLKRLEEEGFKDGAGVKIDYQNCQGELPACTQIVQRFVDTNVDVIVPLGTPPGQAALKATEGSGKPPLSFAMSLNPYTRGLATTATEKPTHVTGVTSLPPLDEGVRLVREVLPGAKRLGVIWDTSSPQSEYMVSELRKAAGSLGFEIVEAPVTKTDEVLTAAETLARRGIDAYYQPNDTTVASAYGSVVKVAIEQRIPFFGSDTAGVEKGIVGAVGVSYDDLGRQDGALIAKILRGTPANTLPIENPAGSYVAVNLKAAELQGITLPEAVLNRAKIKLTELKG